MHDSFFKFLREYNIINMRVILTVITFNLMNTFIEEILIPTTHRWWKDDDFNIYEISIHNYKNPDYKKTIRSNVLLRKIIVWTVIFILCFFIYYFFIVSPSSLSITSSKP